MAAYSSATISSGHNKVPMNVEGKGLLLAFTLERQILVKTSYIFHRFVPKKFWNAEP
jgi:hypothetical protein